MASLSRKDRRALFILGIAVIVFAAVRFILFPLLDERKRLERGISSKENGLTEMQAMQKNISRLSRRNNTLGQRVAERPENFSLFAFLEQQSARTGVKENIAYMKPSDPTGEGSLQQIMVEMKFKAIPLNRLVDFLKRVESPEHIVELQRISVQTNKKERGTLDVIMQVISLIQQTEEGGN
ncbi:MAG: hypothetical protein ACL93V_12965 [Candidatus Electrothrix sp. YB6]